MEVKTVKLAIADIATTPLGPKQLEDDERMTKCDVIHQENSLRTPFLSGLVRYLAENHQRIKQLSYFRRARSCCVLTKVEVDKNH